MHNHIIFSLPGNNTLTSAIAQKLKIEIGTTEIRDFPDGETYVRIDSDVKNKFVILVCALDHPNNKILPLIFMAQTLKELGANKICLVSPYLPYMRQDKRFKSGEAITSILFANILSNCIDDLITIDPHLHRIQQLSDIYSMDIAASLHATKKMAEWICKHVELPLIIGPDEESKQWVAEVAALTNSPYVIIKKTRFADRKVNISVPEIKELDRTPVLVDDIISTGMSMLAVISELMSRGFKPPICIGVHALFDSMTYDNLLQAGARQVITCNTILHPTNGIDVTDVIVEEVRRLL